jgi:hypothetical protein
VRHLLSVVLGPVIGAIVYLLFGFAGFKVELDEGWTADTAVGVATMVVAAVLYALLVVPRMSPIGPALVGVAYLGLGLWLVSDLSGYVSTMPDNLLGLDNAGFGPGLYLIPLSIPLLATLVSPNKWRGRPLPAAVGSPPPPGGMGGPPLQQPYAQPPLQPSFDQPPSYDSQPAGYGGNPPIGAPYSGPPSYGPPPGSPVGYPDPGQGQYGNQQGGYPPDQLRPDVTRRIQ